MWNVVHELHFYILPGQRVVLASPLCRTAVRPPEGMRKARPPNPPGDSRTGLSEPYSAVTGALGLQRGGNHGLHRFVELFQFLARLGLGFLAGACERLRLGLCDSLAQPGDSRRDEFIRVAGLNLLGRVLVVARKLGMVPLAGNLPGTLH